MRNNTRGLSRHNPPQTIKELICESALGYCCEWAFFQAHTKVRTGLVAARLGVSERAIRYHREIFREGGMECSSRPNCMKERVAKTKHRLGER